MRKILTSGLVVVTGLIVPVTLGQPGSIAEETNYEIDTRFLLLNEFFEERDCPAQEYAAHFLAAADRHKLDWRLLPSISLVESSGGKYYRNNNILGWDNGRQEFPSVRSGIYHVASRLANSKFYRNKTTEQMLRVYNPNPGYGGLVQRVMRQVGPLEPPPQANLN